MHGEGALSVVTVSGVQVLKIGLGEIIARERGQGD